jgi:hypothetical protein
MALLLAVRGQVGDRTAFLWPRSPLVLASTWAALLILLVAGPWLFPGYLFGTDWPGARQFPFPTEVASYAPFEALLAALSRTIGGEATGKLLIIAILGLAGFGVSYCLPTDSFVGRAVAATVYVLNPFVYGRLQYGQLFVLAGYAALPLVAFSCRKLLLEPTTRNALLAAASIATVGALSLHLFLAALVLVAALGVAHLIHVGSPSGYWPRTIRPLLIAALASFAVCAYWLVPLLTGQSSEGGRLAAIGNGDIYVYATVADPQAGLLPNVFGLYGFWAENAGRFTSMKVFVPAWQLALAALLVLCGVGAWTAVSSRDHVARFWATGLLAAAAAALILEVGVSHPATSWLIAWLDTHFAPYKGMRDAGKWAALLAFIYAQLAGLGAAAVFQMTRRSRFPGTQTEWQPALAAGLLLALPLYYGNGLLYGMHGEIKPSEYPAGWYAADRTLLADPQPGRTLFLPWHQYMSYSFIQNQNKVVACPAPTFFSVPIVSSSNPEIGETMPTDPEQVAISTLVGAGAAGAWAERLTSLHIKYILVAKELDWQNYDYLVKQPGIALVKDFGSILLYQNTLHG